MSCVVMALDDDGEWVEIPGCRYDTAEEAYQAALDRAVRDPYVDLATSDEAYCDECGEMRPTMGMETVGPRFHERDVCRRCIVSREAARDEAAHARMQEMREGRHE